MFDFGEFTALLEVESVTDLNYNGRDLWVDDYQIGRYVIEVFWCYESIERMVQRLMNVTNTRFNEQIPVMETDYHNIRISVFHESIAARLSLSIRKTSMIMRLDASLLESSGYMSKAALRFLKYALGAKCNIVISGLPGSGKTELLKFLTQFFNQTDRVITIEDAAELHYATLHPHRDSVALKVNANFGYEEALKACLRQRPNWLLLSETRGQEIMNLLACVASGVHVMSTIHAKNAFEIPERMMHMMPHPDLSSELLKQRLYASFDVGIYVEAQVKETGVFRYVREIVVFSKEGPIEVYNHQQKRLLCKIPDTIRESALRFGVKW